MIPYILLFVFILIISNRIVDIDSEDTGYNDENFF
jgi:hypothetical protein